MLKSCACSLFFMILYLSGSAISSHLRLMPYCLMWLKYLFAFSLTLMFLLDIIILTPLTFKRSKEVYLFVVLYSFVRMFAGLCLLKTHYGLFYRR